MENPLKGKLNGNDLFVDRFFDSLNYHSEQYPHPYIGESTPVMMDSTI